jgi:hypothetical protein
MSNKLNEAAEDFNANCKRLTGSKINYKETLEQNFEAFSHK